MSDEPETGDPVFEVPAKPNGTTAAVKKPGRSGSDRRYALLPVVQRVLRSRRTADPPDTRSAQEDRAFDQNHADGRPVGRPR
jgi:hypothetical protein